MSNKIDYKDVFKGINKRQICTAAGLLLCFSLVHTLSCYSLEQWSDWVDLITNRENYDCAHDMQGNFICKPNCFNGTFSLFGMNRCEPLLNCNDLDFLKMNIEREISTEIAKTVQVVKWNDYDLTLIESKDTKAELEIMKPILRQNVRETQVIGICGNTFIKEFM